MNIGELLYVGWELMKGFASSTVFVLVLFIGFCVLVGFTKLKKTAGGKAAVVKSLDERVTHRSFDYLAPSAPRGPADVLKNAAAGTSGGGRS